MCFKAEWWGECFREPCVIIKPLLPFLFLNGSTEIRTQKFQNVYLNLLLVSEEYIFFILGVNKIGLTQVPGGHLHTDQRSLYVLCPVVQWYNTCPKWRKQRINTDTDYDVANSDRKYSRGETSLALWPFLYLWSTGTFLGSMQGPNWCHKLCSWCHKKLHDLAWTICKLVK